jgi:hypothetical protein
MRRCLRRRRHRGLCYSLWFGAISLQSLCYGGLLTGRLHQGPAVGDLRVAVRGERRAHLVPAASASSRTTIAPPAIQQFRDARQRWVQAAWRGRARLGRIAAAWNVMLRSCG